MMALLSGVGVNAVLASHFGLLGDYYGPPPGLPSAPTNVQVISACESLQVVWNPPATDGGSAVTGYVVRVRVGGQVVQTQAVDGATFSTTISGLTDGTSYTVTVSAVNSAGEGPESAPVDAMPQCVPSAPIAVVAVAQCGGARVDWGAPLHDGGSPITGYVVWVRNGGQLVASDRVAAAGFHDHVPGLANGETYDVSVSAINVLGVGPPSAVVTVVPHCGPSVPTAPIEVFGSPLCGGAQLDWSPPLNDGSTAIHGYVVWVRQSGQLVATDVVDGSTFTDAISGLTDGATYQVTVAGVNGLGVGAESVAVDLTPECAQTVPDPPLQVSATPLCGGLEIDWNAPNTDGGTPITGYTVFVRQGEAIVATDVVDGSTFSDTVMGLTNGGDYTVSVAATNANGMGAESATVDVAPECPATAPTAPQSVTAAPLCEAVNVGWNAPASDGGVPVTSYTVYVRSDGLLVATDTVDAATLADTISGLTDGTGYTVTVAATNIVGTSVESSPPVSVTPLCAPTPPQSVTAAPLCESVNVGWNAPASDGGTAITSYTVVVRWDGGQASYQVNGTTLSDVVSGLTDGTPYTVTVFATNAIGDSQDSSPPVAVTPVCAPTQPQLVTAGPQCESVNVGWSTPVSDGGSPITSYTVYVRAGGSTTTDTVAAGSNADTISGLGDGTLYSVTVVATNAIGDSLESSPPALVTPVCAPTAPLSVNATPTCSGAVVSWSPPANPGGLPTSSYTVFVRSDGGPLVTDTVGGSTLTDTISRLTGGVTYSVTVAATNSLGTSAESSPPATFIPTCIADSLQYNGDLQVKSGSAMRLSAQLTSANVGCRVGQPIVFTLDRNPVTQAAGPFSFSTVTHRTGGTGIAAFAVSTRNWQAGSYTVSADYAGTPPAGGKEKAPPPHCTPAHDSAPITVYVIPRGPVSVVASGVGTIVDNGNTSFALTITVPRKTTDYSGVFVLSNGNNWRLVGSVDGYTKTGRTTATATVTGDLFYYASNRTWQLAASNVDVVLTLTTGGRKRGKLGVEIDYTPVAPQPSQLPNTDSTFLTAGSITVH